MSEIKTVAYNLMVRFDRLAQPRITHNLIRWFWNKFFLPHAQSSIQAMDEKDLKAILWEGYNELKPIFERTKRAEELTELRSLNDNTKARRFVESIKENADALELVP